MPSYVIVDIETNGLLHSASKIWCVCCIDLEKNKGESFYGKSLTPELVGEYLNKFDTIVGHNFLRYDAPILNKLLFKDTPQYKIKPSKVLDTLILSRLANPNRSGGHSLENFGEILGYHKREHEDWTQFSDDMLKRCQTDVVLNKKVFNLLRTELKGFSKESIEVEHKTELVLFEMNNNGFYLDIPKASGILEEVSLAANSISEEVSIEFPCVFKEDKLIQARYNKDGRMSSSNLKWLPDYQTLVCGDFTRLKREEFNMDSPKQVTERMEKAGWKPIVFNKPTNKMKESGIKRGSPKVCEENLATLPKDAPQSAHKIARYLMLTSRKELIQGLFNALGDDKRVHGECISIGAITHRMAHRNPNMSLIPSVTSEYGKELRACLTVDDPDKRCLVGVDLAAIQLRILAHYVNDPTYTDVVANGDVHTKNMELTGGMIKERSVAKTFIYAWLLGAGYEKLGLIIGGNKEAGKELNDTFLGNFPQLKKLKEVTTRAAANRGWVLGFDGRRIPIKSHHHALSSYLQGGEAVVMKKNLILVREKLLKARLDSKLVSVSHDETQRDTLKEHAEQVAKICLDTIPEVGLYFNLNIPIKGECKIGKDWFETH